MRSYKKQSVKKIGGRILDFAWLKVAVARPVLLGLNSEPGSCVVLQTGAWEGLKT